MSNIERTDTNVGSIEEIKRCEQLIKPEHANWIGISNQLAIAHLIEKIKELEEENKKKSIEIICYQEELENSIPVQKVNDEIEKYEYMLAKTIHGEIQKYTPGEILLKIDTLKEILEEK